MTTATGKTAGDGPWKKNYLILSSVNYDMQGEYKCDVAYERYGVFNGGTISSKTWNLSITGLFKNDY